MGLNIVKGSSLRLRDSTRNGEMRLNPPEIPCNSICINELCKRIPALMMQGPTDLWFGDEGRGLQFSMSK